MADQKTISGVTVANVMPMQSRELTIFFLDVTLSGGIDAEIRVGITSQTEKSMGGIDAVKEKLSNPSYLYDILEKSKTGQDGIKLEGEMIIL